jgi:hypothetical protein
VLSILARTLETIEFIESPYSPHFRSASQFCGLTAINFTFAFDINELKILYSIKDLSVRGNNFKMGRIRKLGNEVCMHQDKDSGIVCGKMCRYGSKYSAGNSKRKLAQKTEYVEALHNDGSKKHNVRYKDYLSYKNKGHLFENFLNKMAVIEEVTNRLSHKFEKIADFVEPHYHKFTEEEKKDLEAGIIFYKEIFETVAMFPVMVTTMFNYITKEGKPPPAEIISLIGNTNKDMTKLMETILELQDNKIDPLAAPLTNVYEKYIFPERKKVRKNNQLENSTRWGIPRSRILEM